MDLEVWKQSMDFVENIYKESALFPKEEVYGLTSQIRRAAVSIPSSIDSIIKMLNGLIRHLKGEIQCHKTPT